MIKKNAKLVLSIVYLGIVVYLWLNLIPNYLIFSMAKIINAGTPFMYFIQMVESVCFIIGAILLIPSGILYLLSYDERKTLANFALGTGAPAWILILIGFGVSKGASFFCLLIPALAMIPIMLFGIILFCESKDKISMRTSKNILHYQPDLRKTSRISNVSRNNYQAINYRNNSRYPTRRTYQVNQQTSNGLTKNFKYCSQCGKKLRGSDKYCYHCGHPQWLY